MFNKRWKELATYGLHVTFVKSRVAGWYKSLITIGPDPKPIGVTHLCVVASVVCWRERMSTVETLKNKDTCEGIRGKGISVYVIWHIT